MSADDHDDPGTLSEGPGDDSENQGETGQGDAGPQGGPGPSDAGDRGAAGPGDAGDRGETGSNDGAPEARAHVATTPVPELYEVGFLPRDVPAGSAPERTAGASAGFASGCELDTALPGPALAGPADEVTGPEGRCDGASDDELIGVLHAWDRMEAWAAGQKLAVIAELIRRRPAPGCGPAKPGGMPTAWGKYCGDELAAATVTSGQAADKTLTLAYDLATRLPGTARALREGIISLYKARIIADLTRDLEPQDAAAAEALILRDIAGKTPGQVRVAAARAVASVDPGAAQARRERAQRDARVELWREDAGTAALCGRDLPPAEALAADQRITAYAQELKAAGLDGTMDQLRARAFLDLALGVRSHPAGPARDQDDEGGTGTATAEQEPSPDGTGTATAEQEPSPDRTGTATAQQEPSPDRTGTGAGLAARINLTVPLATLLGLAERPGEAGGFGAIDPALARALADAATTDPRTTWCVTVTDQHGQPTGHGCARPAATAPGNRGHPRSQTGGQRQTQRHGRPQTQARGQPAFIQEQGNGPAGGYGRWRLQLGGSREFLVSLGPLAVLDCDHRHESTGYQPSDTLRHLVEIRDGECTYPPCRRAARRCDFEHAIPWDQGGRTCICNAGPCCRHHHHQKQAAGWKLEQNQPGYHTWTTPAGRRYTTGPITYPV